MLRMTEETNSNRVATRRVSSRCRRTNAEPEFQRARRILIVDDNVDLARGIARRLQLYGHDVQIAHDGLSGLERWPRIPARASGAGHRSSRHRRLPARGAGQARRWLKGVTLVAISGYDRDDDRVRAHGAGFDHHLVKPIDCDDLIKLLKDLK